VYRVGMAISGNILRLKPLLDWLVYVLHSRLPSVSFRRCRIETCHAIARVLSVVACDIARLRYSVVDENLRHAFPHWMPGRDIAICGGCGSTCS